MLGCAGIAVAQIRGILEDLREEVPRIKAGVLLQVWRFWYLYYRKSAHIDFVMYLFRSVSQSLDLCFQSEGYMWP